MYYVYILRDKNKKNYIGYSNNLQKRLSYHRIKQVGTTKKHDASKLVWYCAFLNKKMALDFEKYLKSGSGHAFFKRRLIK